eukprot:Amastigsp_a3618_15.p2 type:complete len:202 gc:universal Amastigsp_a3618_15:823-218(-)
MRFALELPRAALMRFALDAPAVLGEAGSGSVTQEWMGAVISTWRVGKLCRMLSFAAGDAHSTNPRSRSESAKRERSVSKTAASETLRNRSESTESFVPQCVARRFNDASDNAIQPPSRSSTSSGRTRTNAAKHASSTFQRPPRSSTCNELERSGATLVMPAAVKRRQPRSESLLAAASRGAMRCRLSSTTTVFSSERSMLR